jgi:prevent-host-death family protein
MAKRYSIAEVRDRLSEVVHEAETGEKITLTRRGKPVAVLVSEHEFARLLGESQGFWEAYQKFRQEVGLDRLGITPSSFRGLRDRTPGRQVKL